MKFLWTTLNVSDFEKSLKFYKEVAGLPLKRQMDAPGLKIAFLGEGETLVELICDSKNPVVDLRAPVGLGFLVSNLAATLEDFRSRGIQIDSGPFQPNPGIRFFFVRDPDGMSVQFVEQTHG